MTENPKQKNKDRDINTIEEVSFQNFETSFENQSEVEGEKIKTILKHLQSNHEELECLKAELAIELEVSYRHVIFKSISRFFMNKWFDKPYSATTAERVKPPPGNFTYRVLSFLMPYKEREKVIDAWRADYIYEINEETKAGNKRRVRWVSILYHLRLVPLFAQYVADWFVNIWVPTKEAADKDS